MQDFLASRPRIGGGNSSHRSTSHSGGRGPAPLPELNVEVQKAVPPEGEHQHAPQMETVVINGRIRRLHIRCSCGEEMVVHCDYPQ